MKNVNIFGVHWKIRLLRGVHKKPIKRRHLPKRGELGQFADLKGRRQERGVGVFEGFDTPMHIMAQKVDNLFVLDKSHQFQN